MAPTLLSSDIRFTDDGATVTVGSSKTDQFGKNARETSPTVGSGAAASMRAGSVEKVKWKCRFKSQL